MIYSWEGSGKFVIMLKIYENTHILIINFERKYFKKTYLIGIGVNVG